MNLSGSLCKPSEGFKNKASEVQRVRSFWGGQGTFWGASGEPLRIHSSLWEVAVERFPACRGRDAAIRRQAPGSVRDPESDKVPAATAETKANAKEEESARENQQENVQADASSSLPLRWTTLRVKEGLQRTRRAKNQGGESQKNPFTSRSKNIAY